MADKNIEIMLKDIRGSFLEVVFPDERRNEAEELVGWTYKGNFLVPKTDLVQVKLVQEAMKSALANTWSGQDKKIPSERRCFRDGEPKDPDTEERSPLYDGYAGCYFLSASRTLPIDKFPTKPKPEDNPVQLIVGRKGPDGKFPRLSGTEAAKYFYSGAYFDVIARVYGYDGKKAGNPDRINASIEAIKFRRHGEAFGAKAVDADNRFDDDDDDGFATPAAKTADDDDDLLG